MTQEPRKRAPKGTVSIESVGTQIGLRFRYGGVQRRIPIGPDTPSMRLSAQKMAAIVAGDIASNNFDTTLKKYQAQEVRPGVKVVELYDRYLQWKFGDGRRADKHKALIGHLKREFRSDAAESIDEDDALEFLEGMECAVSTQSAYRTILRECWREVGRKLGLKDNPWDLVTLPKDEEQKEADPFDEAEVVAILEAFERTNYEGYVRGLLGTGARPGEVSALTWGDVDFKKEEVSIVKAWSDRRLTIGPTKTKRRRKIPLEEGLKEYLLEQWNEEVEPEDILFPSPTGKHISAKLFLKRHWIPALARIGVRYRPTYNTRHSTWSHNIAEGMPIAEAAKLAGNRPETMVRRYLGSVSKTKMKNLTGRKTDQDRSLTDPESE
jgi:integrase